MHQQLNEYMSKKGIGFLWLTETRAPKTSTNAVQDFLFITSSGVAVEEREYAGVGAILDRRWKTALVAVQPRGSRALVLVFRDPLRLFYVVVTYAPHEGRPTTE
eukprot:13015840-Alexandrium_andersonii.AAC.1